MTIIMSLVQPSVIELKSRLMGPRGDYHVGHQTWPSKLAQVTEGLGYSLQFSMLSPPWVYGNDAWSSLGMTMMIFLLNHHHHHQSSLSSSSS